MTPARLGLVGAGIAHSLSPALHGHYLRQAGLAGSYALLHAPTEAAARHWLTLVRAGCLRGVNVTTPHKALAAAWAGAAEPAVNTVYRQGSELRACNTDGPGLVDALDQPLAGVRALVLGSGGAALACLPWLRTAGARTALCGRNLLTTKDVASATGAMPVAWGQAGALADADLVLHLSRFGHGRRGPCSQPELWNWLPWQVWSRNGTRVVDGVYARGQATWFEQVASHNGVSVGVGFGVRMLAAQAARSFERFAGDRPDWRAALAATSCTSA